jgi:hypothetical protein
VCNNYKSKKAMKFLTTNTALVMVVLIIMTVVSSLNAADDSNARRSSLRLRSSISSSSSSSSWALSSSSKAADNDNDNDNDNDGKETEKQEERDELQNFWASENIADIDSMVITKAPTPAPTTSLGPSSKLPDDDDFSLLNLNLTGTVQYDEDQQKLTSYSTFCRPGKFTNVQIVSLENKFVLCINTIGENAIIEFGDGTYYPNPLIKLNPGPPRTCDNEDEDEDDSSSGQKNYCGFRGKQNTTTFSSIVNTFSNEGVVAVDINEIFSYTTYCQVNNYTNVRIVGIDTSITCITSDQGGTISVTNGIGGDIVQVLADGNKSDSSCDFIANGTSSNSGLVKDSTKCGFDGVANTVYTNFPDN